MENAKGVSIVIRQPETGYRYSIDSVILAWHARPLCNQKVLDMGTGCGIVSIILARRFADIRIYGIEIQKSMACLAQWNILKNKMADRVKVICDDLRNLTPKDIDGPADLVVANPPFEKVGCSRIGSDYSKSVATHEISASLSDVVECSKRVLRISGALLIIFPAHRLMELFYELRTRKMEPKWVRMVHPYFLSDANRVIVKAVKYGSEGLAIGPPLYVHQADRSYTPEVESMFLP